MYTPSAPSMSAAAIWRPVETPPAQMTGMSSASTQRGVSTMVPRSFSPGWPAHSKPSATTMSAPSDCALSACLTVVHLWMSTMPASLMARTMSSFGGRPAVSMTLTPSSAQTRM